MLPEMSHFQPILKSLSLHSSFHVWFCFQDSMINRRGRAGGRRERDRETEGDREEGKSMLSGEPDAFANWLFVCFIRVWKRKSKLRPGICLQPSRIAGIVHWIQLIYVFRSPDHAFRCTVVRLNYSSHTASSAGNSNPFRSQRWICCFWL